MKKHRAWSMEHREMQLAADSLQQAVNRALRSLSAVSGPLSVAKRQLIAHGLQLTGKMLISQIVNSSNGQMVETLEIVEVV